MKRTIYLLSNGRLFRQDGNICFEDDVGKKQFLAIEQISEIFVFGEISMTKKLLELLSYKGIMVHFFNFREYYVGTYYPKEYYNSGFLTLKQAEHYLDIQKRLYLARKFIEGGVKNMLKVLVYFSNRGIPVDGFREKIEEKLQDLHHATDTDELMSLEGNIREIYYDAFDIIIRNKDFEFGKRSKRPPENRLNALISFGNSLLYSVILSEIHKTHLDPRIGFLHATNFRRFSLNLDLAEVFKPIIVDRLIFSLINKKVIKAKHFNQELSGVFLSEEGCKLFLEHWESKMKTTISHRTLGRNVSYRRLLRIELYKVERHLIGDKTYEPFVGRW